MLPAADGVGEGGVAGVGDGSVVGDGPGIAVLVMPVGDDRVALPLTRVREVLVAPAFTPLPTAGGAVLGLCNWRGEVVAVLDTRRLLGRAPGALADRYLTVVEVARGVVGLTGTGLAVTSSLSQPAQPGDRPGTGTAFVTALVTAFATGSGAGGELEVTLLDPDVLLEGLSGG